MIAGIVLKLVGHEVNGRLLHTLEIGEVRYTGEEGTAEYLYTRREVIDFEIVNVLLHRRDDGELELSFKPRDDKLIVVPGFELKHRR